ncbi:hypothetical protein AK830_g10477 [Neonectria ditissima]|uniref:Uncharacterized protein n=1 Tax=Neonectria ditissima TaxID=78410 RepID=A0A0N8H5G3_9HYPO|nr:hypothetical protein AK830_g10477 [Neonectria ditissima]
MSPLVVLGRMQASPAGLSQWFGGLHQAAAYLETPQGKLQSALLFTAVNSRRAREVGQETRRDLQLPQTIDAATGGVRPAMVEAKNIRTFERRPDSQERKTLANSDPDDPASLAGTRREPCSPRARVQGIVYEYGNRYVPCSMFHEAGETRYTRLLCDLGLPLPTSRLPAYLSPIPDPQAPGLPRLRQTGSQPCRWTLGPGAAAAAALDAAATATTT